jgi:(5-formylfuran-3-yl)methyl phosphate synthase
LRRNIACELRSLLRGSPLPELNIAAQPATMAHHLQHDASAGAAMTLMLASVTGPDEAEIALEHGADIIDLKDPTGGSLRALPPDLVRASVAAVAGRRPVSAVAGDLPMEPDALVAAVGQIALTGVDYVKVGLFPGRLREDCVRALSALTAAARIVAVMFADQEPDPALISLIAECGFAGAMLDTARKGSGRLLDHADVAFLQDFVDRCRSRGLLTGLAGSLEPPDIPRLLLLAPDFLGFRRALCGDRERAGRINPQAVRVVRELIPRDDRGRGEAGQAGRSDHRVLPVHPYAQGASLEEADRIFVRDFVMPVRVGAYAHELDRPQNVRFNVDVTATRLGRPASDIGDVLSYDVIMDAIRIVVAREHIPLVEMLAERIAASLLAHQRVTSVTVRVEKLDIGPGAVGVEIKRERQADVANVYQLYPAAAGKPRLTGSE